MLIITRRGRVACLAAALWAIWTTTAAGEPAEFMMRAMVGGETIEGLPLYWTDTQMLLLSRNGGLREFDPRDARHSRKSGRFFGYSMSEMKQDLYREFGKTSELTTTHHYIVVHPERQKSEWADRFEQLYRSFHHYFRVRGFRLKEPDYPLVAIVFRNRAAYDSYTAKVGDPASPQQVGHYSPASNRVFLYDRRPNGGDWTTTADTIIHEATHQTAFNCGIHKRFTGTPKWVAEGLATMFEARGVYDSQASDRRADRINAYRHRRHQQFVGGRRPEGFMAQLIAHDNAFTSDGDGAYAESWALTFYLVETRPRQYAEYVARTADREMMTDYSAAERIADFREIFHHNLPWLERQFLSFMEELR